MNHYPPRATIPPGPQPGAFERLNNLLDSIRVEFENESRRSVDYDAELTRYAHEVETIRARILQLEQQHQHSKRKYEEEIAHLQREIEARGGHPVPQPPVMPNSGNLFNGIMAGNASQGGPGLVPPPQESQQPHGLPPHMAPHGPPGPPALNPAPGPPSHFQAYPQGPSQANGYPQPQPPSPGNKRGAPRQPPGLATPQQNTAAPYPPASPAPRPTPPPPHQHANGAFTAVNSRQSVPPVTYLAELDLNQLPENLKKEGDDWFAVWNPNGRRQLDVELIHTLAHQSVVCCVRFSMDGRFVATGCNRSAQIYDVETGAAIAHLQDNTLPEDGDLYIRSVCFSPSGQYLATGAEDKVIRVWDIAAGTIKHQFTGHEQDIYSLDYARNGRFIASGSGDRTVRLWDLESSQQVQLLEIEDGVTTVAISPDNRFVAAGSLDRGVRVWDAGTGQLVLKLEGETGHSDSVYSVAFAPSGDRLVSGSLDTTIKMWELNVAPRTVHGGAPTGRCIRTFQGHKDYVLSVALTPNGDWVLSGSKDRGVQFWDPTTGVVQLMLQGHKNSVISVAPSPTGGIFATGSGDYRARIWRYAPVRAQPYQSGARAAA
ncbi:transcriptional repressor rco-1 [Sporormia fimetaria CBS 119925]|uniref:Transcriptional repressor rco-1 n=1 Tax=Sporormia fimetaria CBS 119925 TaxID=1340428 RepID=A0A6A6VKU9_9PLEO|nr:transcriptional repressor rco-1 [Sporormia fimetaria CBS 119925]